MESMTPQRGALVPLVIGLLATTSFGQADSSLRLGMESLRAGRFQEALIHLDRAKQTSPEDARPYFYSGLALFRSGQALQAMTELEKAVELDPPNPQYSLVCAEVMLRNGYKFRALSRLEALEPFLDVPALEIEQLWFLSDLWYRVEKPDKALPLLQRYRSLRPEDERTPFREGQVHLSLNDLDAALAAFERALETTTRRAEGNYGVGMIRFRQGELEEARRFLEAAVEAEPTNPEYVHLLATVLLGLGAPEEALRRLRPVEELGDRFPLILDAMARAYGQLRETETARGYRRRFIELDAAERTEREIDQRVHGLLQEGQRLSRAGQLVEALDRFEEAVRIDPESFLAHSYLAGIQIARGQWRRAEEHLVRLEELDSEAFETSYLRAQYFHQRGELEAAREWAEGAKDRQPGFAELRNLLGNIHFALGEFGKARQEYGAAVSLEPDRLEFQVNLETASRRAEESGP
jgi:tetratricopeptide (TPR) repeat protein